MKRLAVLIILALVATSTPAVAATGVLAFSRDGSTWVDSLDSPLFDPAFLWVPGDTESETFLVKNQSDDNAMLSIEAVGLDSGLFAQEDVELRIRVDEGSWQQLTAGNVSLGEELAAGDSRRFDIEVAFLPTAGNDTQLSAFPLTFEVFLSDASGGESDDPNDSESDEKAIALDRTGGDLGTYLILAAAAIAASGLILLGVARRRNLDESEQLS